MEISQHIKNLLKSNERVILGGFGAFNTKQISAKYDAETKTMNPPHKIVTFDQNTKEDAGLLAKHMAEQEGISLDNANEQIREYVKMINSRLSSGQKVEFKELGAFSQASDGTLNFTFLSGDNLLIDSFGLSTVSLDSKSENTPVKQATIKKPIQKKPVDKRLVEKKPVKQKPIKQKPVKKAKPVKNKTTSEKPKKRRVGLLVFLIFIAAIGITLTALYFFKPDLWDKGYAFSTEKFTAAKSKITQLFNGDDTENYDIITPDEINEVVDTSSAIDENIEVTEDSLVTEEDINNEEISEEIIPEEELIETETVVEDPVEEVIEPVATNTTVSPAQKGKYYIIVSSVRTEASAKKEQKRFSAKGISTSIIHAANIGRYRISAGEFSTIRSAQNAYSDIQAKHGNIDAWVWEKR